MRWRSVPWTGAVARGHASAARPRKGRLAVLAMFCVKLLSRQGESDPRFVRHVVAIRYRTYAKGRDSITTRALHRTPNPRDRRRCAVGYRGLEERWHVCGRAG